MKTIEFRVFGSYARAFIEGREVDISLPSWSGHITRSEAIGQIAKLRKFLDRVDTELKASTEYVTSEDAGSGIDV